MLQQNIESILFIAARPLTVKRLAEVLEVSKDEVDAAINALVERYNHEHSGIRILRHAHEVQMTTAPENAKQVQQFLKDETTSELTKPSLETLTIIAYRGPLSKAELEQIRGVNCSVILRNVMMRGLVEANGEAGLPQTEYTVTTDFVRHLGLTNISELPQYETLRSHETIENVLKKEVSL